ncbi:MAG: cytochrome c3 family protein [Planctomycetes bacterium]|nr:cytochrome c3 family protein [Planctomycetota bacterium]
MQGRTRLTVPLPLPLLLAAAALLALPGPAMAGWDGMQDIGLGDKISAEFGSEDSGHHEFRFYAPKGTTVDVKAKADPGVVLAFELWSDKGVEVDLTGATAAGFKKIVIPADGTYLLHVMSEGDAGIYSLTTKGKFPTSATVEGTTDPVFGALAGSTKLQVSVKPAKGSEATAVINAIKYPGGALEITAGTTVKFDGPLTISTQYTVDLAVTGAGNVATTIKLKAPKFKRSWSFGIVEPVLGTPATVRAAWLTSPHNDYTSEAFRHWDADGDVTSDCAKCHSSYGYQDWVGADGSAFEVVDADAALGSTVDCDACHNSGTADLSTVLFPSGKRVDGLGMEARCMQCHQGRESAKDVDEAIAALPEGTGDDDIPDANGDSKSDLAFLNVHYLPAGATLYGREAAGGYQYEGEHYTGKFAHVKNYDTCIECHDAHSTTLKLSECAACHTGVEDYDDLQNIRMIRTYLDYDGDGNVTEGIAKELQGMSAALYAAIQNYGTQIGHGIEYDAHVYPYFFNAGTSHNYGTRYAYWTPRLLRAAYNYQYSQKDPGVYAHNARYVMEMLHDSYNDINSALTSPVTLVLQRGEEGGHFDATSMAYRDWDKDEGDSDGLVNTSCAQCHSGDGFTTYMYNFNISSTGSVTEVTQTPASPAIEGMPCESCHIDGIFDEAGVAKLRYVKGVVFPSSRAPQTGAKKLTNGTQGTSAEDPSFLCMTCHQGRNSKQTYDDYFAWNTDPTKWSFQNVHYAAVGAMQYGNQSQVGYEYTGKTYAGKWVHGTEANSRCTYCHMQPDAGGKKGHSFLPGPNTTCAGCHGSTDASTYRLNATTDYDGDGNTTESLENEVKTYADRLYAQIRTVSTANGYTLVYYADANPYWFHDVNNNDVYDTGDLSSTGKWTQALMKAAHNYQFYKKETAGWFHNRNYVMQLLYDSLQDLGGSTAGLTRP